MAFLESYRPTPCIDIPMPYEALRIDSTYIHAYCATSLDMKAKQVYNNTEENKLKETKRYD